MDTADERTDRWPETRTAPDDRLGDGRHGRRDRNMIRVTDAYLDLIGEGNLSPTVADVSERSGLSHRSVFRYFSDKQELASRSIERQIERLSPLLSLGIGPDAPLDDRIEHLVKQRLTWFDNLGPIARMSRMMAATSDIASIRLSESRAQARQRIRWLFATELDSMPADRADDVMALIDVLCSFEAGDLFQMDMGLDDDRVTSLLSLALGRFLRD
jgi:AcrR family transcriptional regulator